MHVDRPAVVRNGHVEGAQRVMRVTALSECAPIAWVELYRAIEIGQRALVIADLVVGEAADEVSRRRIRIALDDIVAGLDCLGARPVEAALGCREVRTRDVYAT